MLRRRGRWLLMAATVWMAFAASTAAKQQSATAPATATISAPSPVPAPLPVTVIDGLGKGSVRLPGPWQFHTGDNLAWASPSFDDSQWEQLLGSDHWGLQGHPDYTGFAWYRLHLTLNPARDSVPDFHILLDGVQNSYELYWNGALIGQDGRLPPHPVWYVNQYTRDFRIGTGGPGVLAIRVWKAPLKYDDTSDEGGLWNAPLVGSADAISDGDRASKYIWSQWTQVKLLLDDLFAVVAVLAFLAWLPRRSQGHLFWIAIFAAFQATALAQYLRLQETQLISSFLRLLFDLGGVAEWFMVLWLLQLRRNQRVFRLTAAVGILAAAIATMNFLLNGFLWSIAWNAVQLAHLRQIEVLLNDALTLAALLPLLLAAAALRKRIPLEHSRWLVVVVVCLDEGFGFLQSVLSQFSRLDHWGLQAMLETQIFSWNEMPVDFGDFTDYLLAILLIYTVYRSSVENRRSQIVLEQEFKSARELQQILIPETLPTIPGYALTSAYRPALEVGGDFFQIIPLTPESTLIVLGDVSGKGLRAAMTVSLIVGAIHALADEDTRPEKLLSQLNQRLHERLHGRANAGFVTCIAMRLCSSGNCTLSSAGHPGPFLNDEELALPGAVPLGLSLTVEYEETTVSLSVDDRLSLFTDGLLEARSPAGELYGFDRLKTLFATRPTATEASDAAVAFGQDDDITVLTLTRLATGAESTAVYSTLKGLTSPAVQ